MQTPLDATLNGSTIEVAGTGGAAVLKAAAALPDPPLVVLDAAYAAVAAGVRRLDSSVGGLGGCPFAPGASGNIATEDLVYLLRDSGITVDVDLNAAIDAARVAQSVVGHELPSALLRAGDRILN